MPELFELVETAFNEVPFFVLPFAVGNFLFAIGFGWNLRLAVLVFNQFPDPVCIITPVGKHMGTFRKIIEQQLRHWGIVHMTRRQLDLDWQTVADDAQMYFCCQSSAASTDTSVSNLFFWAAACWWTRTLVESII